MNIIGKTESRNITLNDENQNTVVSLLSDPSISVQITKSSFTTGIWMNQYQTTQTANNVAIHQLDKIVYHTSLRRERIYKGLPSFAFI